MRKVLAVARARFLTVNRTRRRRGFFRRRRARRLGAIACVSTQERTSDVDEQVLIVCVKITARKKLLRERTKCCIFKRSGRIARVYERFRRRNARRMARKLGATTAWMSTVAVVSLASAALHPDANSCAVALRHAWKRRIVYSRSLAGVEGTSCDNK